MTNKDKTETFNIELPESFIEEHFGEGLSELELAKKIEDFLKENIELPINCEDLLNREPIISSFDDTDDTKLS